MNPTEPCRVRPSPGVAGVEAYSVPKPHGTIDLHLEGNEGVAPPADLLGLAVQLGPEVVRRYPSTRELEALLAARFGVDAAQVIVTGGGDDALARACVATLGPDREFVLPVPTFEMLERYAQLVGATAVCVAWPSGPYPTDAVMRAIGPRTGAVAVVTPNNPTGAVASAADLPRLSAAAPHALLIVDLAYGEFADEDLTPAALALPNAIVVRTFSKAWGLAGLRVGYAIGPRELIGWLRAAGSPYPTSGLSLALAARRLETGGEQMGAFVQRVRSERAELHERLRKLGADALSSQGNFVLVRFRAAQRVCDELAAAGIAVRGFPNRPGLENSVRITCPGQPAAFARLCAALEAVHASDPAAF